MFIVNNDTKLVNRTIWMNFGLLDKRNVMKIATKSCGNKKMVYKVDESTACYLNYCSKISDHGKVPLSNVFNL